MSKKSYVQAIRDVTAEEMRRDEKVFVMGEDIEVLGGIFGATRGLADEFGADRVRNTPISEAGFIVTPVNLTISKIIKGSAANPAEHFTFTLTASRLAGKTFDVIYNGTQNCSQTHASQIIFDQSGNASVVLKNGESATIQQITSGDVRIKEESGDYWASVTVNGADERYDQENGILLNIDNTNVTAAFTNQMEQQPVTGIAMMTFPYVLILCIAVLALGHGYARRKRNV